MTAHSRREFLRAFSRTTGLTCAFARLYGATANPSLHIDRLLSENNPGHWTSFRRAYRADATVSLLGMPVFSRLGVGEGFVVLREGSMDGRQIVSMQFAGKSSPDRAHGINDCGSIEEVVIQRSSTVVESAYFAFITGSPDETVNGTRERAERPPARGSSVYTAIDAHHLTGEARHNRASVVLAADDLSDCDDVVRQVRSAFYTGRNFLERRLSLPPEARGTVPATFLYAITAAAHAQTPHFDCPFVYDSRLHQLHTEKSRDEHTAAMFFAKGLTAHPENVVRILGEVCAEHRPASSFKLWIEEGARPALPLRIEFQPRSYLRVSLEYDPSLDVKGQRAAHRDRTTGKHNYEET